jgi:hypothetical protein
MRGSRCQYGVTLSAPCSQGAAFKNRRYSASPLREALTGRGPKTRQSPNSASVSGSQALQTLAMRCFVQQRHRPEQCARQDGPSRQNPVIFCVSL